MQVAGGRAGRFLRRADTLDGGAVLPRFDLKLADLFPEPLPDSGGPG